MAKAPKFGVSTYEKVTRKSIGRHKKNMSKGEKRSYKKNRGQGR